MSTKKSKKEINRDELIKKGIELKSQIDIMQEELQGIKDQLMDFFPGEKTKEDIVTPFGVVTCSTSNSYKVPVLNFEKIKKELGESTMQYVQEKISYGLTALGRDAVNSGEGIGKKLYPLIELSTTKSISFKAVD